MEPMQPIRWMRQHKTPIAISLVIITLLIVAGIWFWGVLVGYIDPRSGPKGVTDRKDVVQAFALIVAGVIDLIGGIVGIANWDTSRRNLQQQRDLEEQRAQEDALQAYSEHLRPADQSTPPPSPQPRRWRQRGVKKGQITLGLRFPCGVSPAKHHFF